MSTHTSVSALRVATEAFLVSSTIERCPKTMMIRELVVNAIEAAGTAEIWFRDKRHPSLRLIRETRRIRAAFGAPRKDIPRRSGASSFCWQ